MLRLEARDSNGNSHVYVVDEVDLLQLVNNQIPFIEVQIQQTPGLRFIVLRYD
jgi:hypothetical protein